MAVTIRTKLWSVGVFIDDSTEHMDESWTINTLISLRIDFEQYLASNAYSHFIGVL